MSGRAVEAAGDCSTLLLDKTGTITYGNRMATEFLPVAGVPLDELAEAALLASMPDETPADAARLRPAPPPPAQAQTPAQSRSSRLSATSQASASS
jgi:potassium-transporting ATPase ATP-binding subunit